MSLNRPIVSLPGLYHVQSVRVIRGVRQIVPAILALTFGVLLIAPGRASGQEKQQWSLKSPDGGVQVEVQRAPLSYSVTFNGQPVIQDSPLGLEFKDQPPFGELKLTND